MTIEVSSASHSQGNYFRVTIDGEVINVPGERGIGLVIVEKGTRKVSMARMFDTELDPEECIKLNNLLLQAHPDAMLIMGVKDDGSRSLSLDLIQTITLLGSKHIKALGYRDSWIFVVRKGKPHRAREVKDSEKAVTLRIPRSPRLRSLVISSSSYQVGNNFSLCINGQPHGGVSYSGDDYRGIVMVVLNNHGEVLFNQIYDTFTCSMESDQLENAIRWQQAQSEGMLMVLGVKDEGSRHLSASLKALIESMGSKEIKELGFRDSWCFLCRIGRPKSAKEGRSSSSPVTLSWAPRLYRPTLPPNQKYSIHYQPPNFSHSLPLSSSLPSSLAPNLVAHQSEAKTTENMVKIKKAYSPPIITKPLVDQPVTSVHQKNAPGAGGVEVGMSVRNNRARRRDTFS